MRDNWKVWDNEKEYGELFYERATGSKEEMESSKAAARHVATYIAPNDTILDVGCGAGHYLLSLQKAISTPFNYVGIDRTDYYITLAKKAYKSKTSEGGGIEFRTGDVYELPLDDSAADIVMCNNVLQHLPSLEKPIGELWRVTRKYMILRTLIGITSFRIKQINEPEEYSTEGEPVNYHYINIYSKKYVAELVNSLNNVKAIEIIDDREYDPEKLGKSNFNESRTPHDLTTVINGMQVNNYIIQPWAFVIVEKA